MKAFHRCVVVALGTAVLLVGVSGELVSAQKYSNWSPPVNLGPVINSPLGDGNPAISKDGLTLYFASNRPGGVGGNDIWLRTGTALARHGSVPRSIWNRST